MRPKIVSRDEKPFHILLIPDVGDAVRLRMIWADATQALDFGCEETINVFFDNSIEVVVIRTATKERVVSDIVERDGGWFKRVGKA